MDNRRGFLKKGVLGTLLLTAGGASFLAFRGGVKKTPTESLIVFDVAAYSIMVAVAEVVMPIPSANALRIAHRVDGSLAYAPPRVQNDIKSALLLLENGLAGLLTRRQISPFSTLSVQDRAVALDRWRDSSVTLLRGAYHGLRKLAIAGHYSEMEKAKETGYPGPAFDKSEPWAMETRKAISKPYIPGPKPDVDDVKGPQVPSLEGETP